MAAGPRRAPIPLVAVSCERDGALHAAYITVHDQGVAFRRRLAGRDDDCGLAAIFLERIGPQDLRHELAVGKLCDASGGVTAEALGERRVVRLPLVAVGSEPFTHGKRV